MRAVVTGGAGFLGARLTSRLVAEEIALRSDSSGEVMGTAAVEFVEGKAPGAVLEVNPAMCAMLGHSEGAMVGRNASEFLNAGDDGGQSEHWGRLVAGALESYDVERRLLRRGGQGPHPVERLR